MSVLTRRTVGFVVLVALLVAACGSSGTGSEPEQALAQLEGEFATLDGTSVDLAELQGQDVVLWFWAPW